MIVPKSMCLHFFRTIGNALISSAVLNNYQEQPRNSKFIRRLIKNNPLKSSQLVQEHWSDFLVAACYSNIG